MIKSKGKIKVIKKNSVKSYKTPFVTKRNLQQKVASEIISTVSDWVKEFEQRRHAETKQAFDRFLVRYPQTGSV